MKNLVRTKSGTFIHRADCRLAQRGKFEPWLWAETQEPSTVAYIVKRFGYRTCSKCRPLAQRD